MEIDPDEYLHLTKVERDNRELSSVAVSEMEMADALAAEVKRLKVALAALAPEAEWRDLFLRERAEVERLRRVLGDIAEHAAVLGGPVTAALARETLDSE